METLSLSNKSQLNPSEGYNDGVHVTLPDLGGLDCLPASGEITFKFKREDVHLRKNGLSATVCLTDITKVKADEEAEDDSMSDAVDKLFSEAKEDSGDEKDE